MPRKSIVRSTPDTANMIDMRTGQPARVSSLPVICERIRHYREQRHIEQKELAKKLGITPNTISNWENGRARPDINLVPGLCDALDVNLYQLYGMAAPAAEKITGRERSLLSSFRELSESHKYAVEVLASTLVNVQTAEASPRIRVLPLFERALAAGFGDPTEFEDNSTPIYLYQDQISSRADCVFTVSGNSMEPVYHNEDLVLVERIPTAASLTYGETGAFIVGNETYIKQYEKDGLHSLNKDYPVMHFEDEDSVYLIGRVLGILDPAWIASQEEVRLYTTIHNE